MTAFSHLCVQNGKKLTEIIRIRSVDSQLFAGDRVTE